MLADLIQKIKAYELYKIQLSEKNFMYRLKYIDPSRSLEEYSYTDIPRCFSGKLDMNLFSADKLKSFDGTPDNKGVIMCQSEASVLALNEQLKIAVQL